MFLFLCILSTTFMTNFKFLGLQAWIMLHFPLIFDFSGFLFFFPLYPIPICQISSFLGCEIVLRFFMTGLWASESSQSVPKRRNLSSYIIRTIKDKNVKFERLFAKYSKSKFQVSGKLQHKDKGWRVCVCVCVCGSTLSWFLKRVQWLYFPDLAPADTTVLPCVAISITESLTIMEPVRTHIHRKYGVNI